MPWTALLTPHREVIYWRLQTTPHLLGKLPAKQNFILQHHIKFCFARSYRWVSARKTNSIANALELRLSCTKPSICPGLSSAPLTEKWFIEGNRPHHISWENDQPGRILFKVLITVRRELQQQHLSDLLSDTLRISLPDNKSRGFCFRNSWLTMINPDYNMNKQHCIKRIYDKICSKSPLNRATSSTCLHCDVMHLSLTTGVAALHISSWRVGVHKEHHQAHKTVWPVNAGIVICHYQNNICGIINHHKYIRDCFFGCISHRFKYNHNEPYRHWCQDDGWRVLAIVMHATAWCREL